MKNQHWVAAWAAAMYYGEKHPYNQGITDAGKFANKKLSGSALRQLIRPAIGGESVRLTFSNEFGETPLTIKAASIAIANGKAGTSDIDTATSTALTFGGSGGVTIEAGGFATSDTLAFSVAPLQRLAVTTEFGEIPEKMTMHVASRANNVLLPDGEITHHWYTLCALDILAPPEYCTIAAIGDSITDGYGIENEEYLRWVDIFMDKLQADPAKKHLSVINMGIGGNGLCGGQDSNPRPVRYLFDRDVISQHGVKYVIISIGVNDLAYAPNPTASQMMEAYMEIIAKAHAKGIKVCLATITPYSCEYGRKNREAIRVEINAQIRALHADNKIEALADFDALLSDPQNPSLLLSQYNLDGIHPNEAGYAAMAEEIFDIFSSLT